jgi:hypothetical protein
MKLYGLMIIKDDEEILSSWCDDRLMLYEAVVCIDGSETDETARIDREGEQALVASVRDS